MPRNRFAYSHSANTYPYCCCEKDILLSNTHSGGDAQVPNKNIMEGWSRKVRVRQLRRGMFFLFSANSDLWKKIGSLEAERFLHTHSFVRPPRPGFRGDIQQLRNVPGCGRHFSFPEQHFGLHLCQVSAEATSGVSYVGLEATTCSTRAFNDGVNVLLNLFRHRILNQHPLPVRLTRWVCCTLPDYQYVGTYLRVGNESKAIKMRVTKAFVYWRFIFLRK